MAQPARDLNVLLESHKAAAELRSKGRPIWAKSIALNDIVKEKSDSQCPDVMIDKCKRIVKLMKATIDPEHLNFYNEALYDPEIAETLEEMEAMSACDFADFEEGVDEFNHYLSVIYDYCDLHRIWTRG